MSNTEIEYKYRVSDLAGERKKLLAFGAKLKEKYEGKDIYFIVPENPEGRKYLRLRSKNEKSEISYSYAKSELETEEWETGVEDIKIAEEIFLHLGYKYDVVIEKQRETYLFEGSEVVLDDVKNLGKFVEIESPNKKELLHIASKLELTEKERVKGMGYPDMLRSGFTNN